MAAFRRLGWGVLAAYIGVAAYGQRPAPVADSVTDPLFPAGISELSVNLNGQLAYLFKADDGTSVVHVVGDFVLRLGEREPQRLRSREAVVWMSQRKSGGRSYRHLQILLWQDAEVHQIGRTVTSGPALFVTLNSFGTVTTAVDDLAYESSAHSQVYREGDVIRGAIAAERPSGPDEGVSLLVFDVSGLGTIDKVPSSRPVIYFRSEGDVKGPTPVDDHQVITVIGGVYLSRGAAGEAEFLEIRADSVVVFLPGAGQRPGDTGAGGLGAEPSTEGADDPAPTATRQSAERSSPDRPLMSTGFGDMEVEAVYLEGDVVMTQGPNMVRASRLYYDLMNDRALILDAVVRATVAEQNIPLYLRAAEIRQLSANRFAAVSAILTTSEFYTPHYHVGAASVELTNRTPLDPGARQTGLRSGSFKIRHATLNFAGTPVGYWPYIRGNIDTSETSIKSIRSGFSDDFGVELETDWHFFNVLGLETPHGFDATLSLDLFSSRGPAAGIDADYKRDRYFGELESYLISDNDEDFLGREREELTREDIRGRFLLRHRQYLEDDWQLSLETSYISDEGFLEEFFESEFDNGKEQETLLYLKKQRDNWAFTSLLQARPLDFTTQTERFGDLGYFVAGEPIGGLATLYSENRAGFVRYRPADQTFRQLLREGRVQGSGVVARADSRQEVGKPIDLGPLRLVPFASIRGTVWDDSIDAGGVVRAFGTFGLRGSMYLSRTFPDIRSEMFDLDGLRHIVKSDITAWVSSTNRDPQELFPFDGTVEQIDEVDGVALGVRQRWQTRRGRGDNRRVVDFLTVDLEAGFFNDAEGTDVTNGFTSFSRPENSITQNYINSSIIWRLNDRTALLHELNFDVNDGRVDILNVSLAVERSPRFSYLFGYRFINEADSNLLGFDMNYRFTEKHSLAVRERFDLDEARTLDFTVAFIRKFPRWFGALSLDLDEPEDDFGVSISVWPEGLPKATLGSRRFTGLGTTTRLRYD